MKLSEIVAKYGFNAKEFEVFLQEEYAPVKGLLQKTLADEYVDEYVRKFQEKLAKEAQEKADEEAEHQRKVKAMSEMLISSGFSFEGYSIVKYSGYISGDDSIEIPRSSSSDHGADICKAMVLIRRQALAELKEAAYNLGCNAVIGVDFDYITLEPETANYNGGTLYEPYVICVTANGNAVVIEKK